MTGNTLRELRIKAGLTQMQLAELAGIGKGKSGRAMLARYETDERASTARPIPHWRVDALKKALKIK